MDVRKLKNYLINTYCELEKNCYFIDKKYIVSDKYSIIALNDNHYLNVIKDTENNYFKNLKKFKNAFDELKTFENITKNINFKDYYYKIDDDYNIDIKLIKQIKNIIKANNIEILEKNSSGHYIIKIENTKTSEKAYLLPCRNY